MWDNKKPARKARLPKTMKTKSATESKDYQLYSDGRFVIRQYNQKKPFSNFLPGIAGLYGTPMWVFYVNRGQGVVSFGTKNKDCAMLEFYPANKAYQAAPLSGFRTFLKFKSPNKIACYEPFRETLHYAHGSGPEQTIEVSSGEFTVRETNRALGIEVSARYFTVPGEGLAALARELTVKNLSGSALDLEVLDGLPSVNPFGMNEFFIKQMSRTIEAWMVAENLEKKAPFLRLRVDASDRPEVTVIQEGNFFFGAVEETGRKGRLAEPVVDPAQVFGSMLDFTQAKVFVQAETYRVPSDQVRENKTPCAFSFAKMKVAPGKSKRLISYFGQARSVEVLNRFVERAKHPRYLDEKSEENRCLIEGLKSPIFTASGSIAYDLYCGQTYLDNILRGGMPIFLGDAADPAVYYVYSRKHGDLERDYNQFVVEPTYFSQGNGNYRDVNQNRRNDVWFDPRVRETNIRTFLNLIQLDGFNPLVLKGAQFSFRRSAASAKLLSRLFGKKHVTALRDLFDRPFNPGQLYAALESRRLVTQKSFNRVLTELMPHLHREEIADHGEGFWIDHWTYNLDLVESYLGIYPDSAAKLLFGDRNYTFYDNAHTVRPRREKLVLKNGAVARQYKSVGLDKEKERLIDKRSSEAHAVRTHHGHGDVYRTSLFVKLLCLFANKLASLDPEGVGIEMEADKPSWYDALNGLPGLLGSSLCETFELKRLALFLIQATDDARQIADDGERLPVELYEFVKKLAGVLELRFLNRVRSAGTAKKSGAELDFWDNATTAKEKFRETTRLGLSGTEKKMTFAEIKIFLEHAREKIETGIEKAYDAKRRLYPTYFENQVYAHRLVKHPGHATDELRPVKFKQSALPLFLEGPVHAMKVEKDPARRRELLYAVRQSGLYDKPLGMYKVTEPLNDASLEIGRARIFTPGWLENESVWLHMEYKFLLELLKGGLTEEYYKDFRRALVPFQPAERYGRSLLENSSFIVSSVFSDPALHGGGFVARLSGSTAEFLSMWLHMNVGKRPFAIGPGGKLSLRFEPQLPEFLFTREETVRSYINAAGESVKVKVPKNAFAFLFLGKTLVVYHNPKRQDTFGKQRVSVKKITLHGTGSRQWEFRSDTVPSPFAAKVRDEFTPRIDIELA